MAYLPIQPLNNKIITHCHSSQTPQPDISDQEDITEPQTQHFKFQFSQWSDIQTPRSVQDACASNLGRFYDCKQECLKVEVREATV